MQVARAGLETALVALGVAVEDLEGRADEAIRPERHIDPFRHCNAELRQILEEGTPLQRWACERLLSAANF
jgi:hypothetical protein